MIKLLQSLSGYAIGALLSYLLVFYIEPTIKDFCFVKFGKSPRTIYIYIIFGIIFYFFISFVTRLIH